MQLHSRRAAFADLREFHHTHFVANNAAVIVVGDVTSGEIMPKLEAAFGSWAQGQVPEMSWPKAEQVRHREVILADNYEASSLPAQFESVSGIAGNLAQLVTYGLPLDYFTRYVDEILAVTQRDVRCVAREYANPERVKVIVVGDRATIEDGIQALDLGPITVLSIEDVLGAKPAVEQ